MHKAWESKISLNFQLAFVLLIIIEVVGESIYFRDFQLSKLNEKNQDQQIKTFAVYFNHNFVMLSADRKFILQTL